MSLQPFQLCLCFTLFTFVPAVLPKFWLRSQIIHRYNALDTHLGHVYTATNFDQTRDHSIAWEIMVQFFQAKMWPLVFDVFYLHKYSHGFSNFNAIQFFQKALVMTVATLCLSLTYHFSCIHPSAKVESGGLHVFQYPSRPMGQFLGQG